MSVGLSVCLFRCGGRALCDVSHPSGLRPRSVHVLLLRLQLQVAPQCANDTTPRDRERMRESISLAPLLSLSLCCLSFFQSGIDPMGVYEVVEDRARQAILQNGGSVSHHHGVGKIRQKYLQPTLSETGVRVIRAVKRELDPQNVMACGNLAR